MFETLTFWIIVAWFAAGLWMVLTSLRGPVEAGRLPPPPVARPGDSP